MDNIFNEESEEVINNLSDNNDDDNDKLVQDDLGIIFPESFDDIPSPIIKRAFQLVIIMLIVFLAIIGGHFLLPQFNYIEMAIAALILGLYASIRAFLIFVSILNCGYVVYRGEVVNIYTEKFDKKSFILQIYDEKRDLYLAFNYAGGRSVVEGTPVSLYLSPNEPIIEDANCGNKVEGYLAVVFSKDKMSSIKSHKTIKDISTYNEKD